MERTLTVPTRPAVGTVLAAGAKIGGVERAFVHKRRNWVLADAVKRGQAGVLALKIEMGVSVAEGGQTCMVKYGRQVAGGRGEKASGKPCGDYEAQADGITTP